MKYLKITIVLFVFVSLISTIMVNAAVKGIAGLEVPAFGGIVQTGQHEKDYFGPQKFELIKCEENITGKETEVEARTHRENDQNNSSWTTLVKSSLIQIAPEHTQQATYRLKVRATYDGNWLTSSLYGTWVLG